MSTSYNHLAELPPGFSANRKISLYAPNDEGNTDDEYTVARAMASGPYYTATGFYPGVTNVPEKYIPTSPELEVGKDDDDHSDSLSASGDLIGELAVEYWQQQKKKQYRRWEEEEHWRWEKLLAAVPVATRPVSTNAPCEAPKFPRFLQLPAEIREMIYGHVFRKGNNFNAALRLVDPDPKSCKFSAPSQSPRKSRPPRLPAVCLTNKLEHQVATRVLARGVGIHLRADGDAKAMAKFLTSIASDPNASLTHIKRAEVEYHGPYRGKGIYRKVGLANDLIFIRQCSQLRDITISVPVHHFFHYLELQYRGVFSPRELGVKLDLNLLRPCTMLRCFTLLSRPNWRLGFHQDWTDDGLLDESTVLVDWIKRKVLSNHKDWSTKLVYTSGTKVPFLTPSGHPMGRRADVNLSLVRGFALESAP